jgi:hypothetical protein
LLKLKQNKTQNLHRLKKPKVLRKLHNQLVYSRNLEKAERIEEKANGYGSKFVKISWQAKSLTLKLQFYSNFNLYVGEEVILLRLSSRWNAYIISARVTSQVITNDS